MPKPVLLWITCCASILPLFSMHADAQIYNWLTGEVIPGTENITPEPEMYLRGWGNFQQNLRYADFSSNIDLHNANFSYCWLNYARFNGDNLSGVTYSYSDLGNADLTGAVLTNANLSDSRLSEAIINGAIISGANFSDTTSKGFKKEQLYSTASYQSGNMQKINLRHNDLTDWNLAAQNLSESNLSYATLTNADFHGTNLENASFASSTITNANFSNATILGASFAGATTKGFTKEQLYSTASYQSRNLFDIDLFNNDLTGWNLANQNLMDASFYNSTLTYADLTGAKLYYCDFLYANLDNTNLSAADMRQAWFPDLSTAILTNTILQDGHIHGMILSNNEKVDIRDFDYADIYYPIGTESFPNASSLNNYTDELPITIDYAMILAEDALLDIILEDDTWGSTMILSGGFVPELNGKLRLGFAPDADILALIGTTFDLFDWNGQLPAGEEFAQVLWDSGHQWDISQLYTTGEVTFLGVPEPATAPLLLLAGLPMSRRKRRR